MEKYCKKCFNYLYVFVNGDVRYCPWNVKVLGNLKENTLEEIWHNESAEEIRRAFLNGELRYCNEEYCPECINREKENSTKLYECSDMQVTKEEMYELYENLPNIPKTISLAYDERCNHACPSCRKKFFQASKAYIEDLELITKNIEPYLSEVEFIITNGIGDLFVSKELLEMLSRFHPKKENFKMHIETNGVLFKANWDKIKHFGDYPLTVAVTPNSFDKETYKYLAGVDDLEKFEESMHFITDLKSQGKVDRIRMIMVIQDSNFRQIPDFIRKSIDVYNADEVILRPIYEWFGLKEDERLYKNVLNPCHPYYKEYLEILKNPILRDPHVFNWGFAEEQAPIEFPTLAMKRDYEKVKCEHVQLKCENEQLKCENEQLKCENEEFKSQNSFVQNIFSVRNNKQGTHKIVTILGIKIKFNKYF